MQHDNLDMLRRSKITYQESKVIRGQILKIGQKCKNKKVYAKLANVPTNIATKPMSNKLNSLFMVSFWQESILI